MSLDENDPEFKDVKFSSYYIGPKSKSCPLIMWPHGGPHSVTLKDFKNEFVFWLKLGFAVLLPNYRGSLGNGQKGVFALTKHAGNFDVKDCYQALQGNNWVYANKIRIKKLFCKSCFRVYPTICQKDSPKFEKISKSVRAPENYYNNEINCHRYNNLQHHFKQYFGG